MISFFDLLKNRIDVKSVPFSRPGSRLALSQYFDHSSLYLHATERLIHFFPGIESYVKRMPFLEELTFIDANQQPLDFEIISYPHVLEFDTRLGTFRFLYQGEHTICIQLPHNHKTGIQCRVNALEWSASQDGGVITSYRFLQYSTNGTVLVNQLAKEAVYSSFTFLVESGSESSILFSIAEDIQTPLKHLPWKAALEQARLGWQPWLENIPEVAEEYQPTYTYAWWVLLNNMFSPKGNLKYNVLAPSKKNYIGIWLWDNALHALALRHIDPQLARDQIRAFLAHQQPDGMLPDAIFDDGIVTEIDHPVRAKVTKPPILAWAALKIHAIDPDIDFLDEIYAALGKWNRWWFQENDPDHDGYIQYNHPFSSGLDDNPTWDFGLPVETPDINTYLYIQMQALMEMATNLGKNEDAQLWKTRAQILLDAMLHFSWDEEKGLFQALYQEKPLNVLTPLNLYPLWTGALPADMVEKLVAHLNDPAEFGGDVIIPSVARCDPTFDADCMWRGPVWANINYFFIEALQKNEKKALAVKLRDKTLALIMQNAGIYEYYNANTGKPGSRAAPAFGWSAAIFIDLAIQASQEKICKNNM
ncbi:MAG: hypothetical protein GYA18_12215 [Chloroflexi bacterium]|nr:hypothetical protein [Chloroflexota bacterium]